MKNISTPSATVARRRRNHRDPWAAKPGTEEARVLAHLKSLGALPITATQRVRMKKFGLIGMPIE